MQPDEQIARFAAIGLKPGISTTVVQAIVRYLKGEIALADVLVEKQRSTRGYHPRGEISAALEHGGERLTEVDLRLLELNHALGLLHAAISSISERGLLFQARDGLLARGMREEDVISACLANSYCLFDRSGPSRPCGQLLMSYLPDRLDLLLQSAARSPNANHQLHLAHLLLHTEPPLLDQAWELITTASHFFDNGALFQHLLKLDGERLYVWARQMVTSAAAASLSSADMHNLLVLLAQSGDPANRAAVADVARHGHPNPQDARASQAAQALLANAPPETYADLAVELSESQQPWVQLLAVRMLRRQPFDRAQPALQRCAVASDPDVAVAAVGGLQARRWAGDEPFMAGLLTHSSKQVRDSAAAWLAGQDGAGTRDLVAPLLAHRSADTRLSAAVLLGKLGGDRGCALLAARLDAEKSEKVRRAIINAVGAATEAAPEAQADPRAAFLSEAATAMRRLRQPVLPWLDPAADSLRWSDAAPLPDTAVTYILYRQSRQKQPSLDPQLGPALALLDREHAAGWAETIWQGWQAQGQTAKESWCLVLAGALGDDRLVVPLSARIEEWTKAGRGALAAQAVHALAVIGSDLALAAVDGIAARVKHNQVRSAAAQALSDAARRAGLSAEELADRIIPTLGFDARGEQTLDYGPRRFGVRLAGGLRLALTDPAGKHLSAPPKPGKNDDPALSGAAQTCWKELKGQLKQASALLTGRLERALVNQRAWPTERWQALFLHHPLLRALAVDLVWLAEHPGDDPKKRLFRPLEDGSLTDAEDEPVTLPDGTWVRLAHPVELDETTQGTWRQHLADYAVAQPFPQIDRPVVRVEPEERGERLWTRYRGYLMNGGALKGRYLKAAWERGPIGDAGSYTLLLKPFPETGLLAVLETAGLTINYEQEYNSALVALAFMPAELPGDTRLPSWLRPDQPHALPLGGVPPVVFSEAAADVQRFADTGAYDEEWKSKLW